MKFREIQYSDEIIYYQVFHTSEAEEYVILFVHYKQLAWNGSNATVLR